uniref:SAM-dependent MTase TRM10-type domain-containing protein n=1 Tax=Meloidogyne enterolobii TaxID=390850 RepID=A0A6V7TXW5_MELEN|nr:unnamed protein product [Meloidogyne enterolobii]
MLSDYPMPISIVNFYSSESVGYALKKHLHFLFGPPTMLNKYELDIPPEIINANLYSKLNDFLDREEGEGKEGEATSNDKENIYKYEPHPFIPEITTKNILDVCKRDGIKKEEIAYISSSATQYLPDDPQIIKERFKAFVLSPLEDRQNPRQRPNFYAPQDQIQVYRLPLEKYLGFRPPTFMPPSTFIELLRVIISGRSSSWDWAIDNRVPNLRIQDLYALPSPWKNSTENSPENFAKIKARRTDNLNLVKEALINLNLQKNNLIKKSQSQQIKNQKNHYYQQKQQGKDNDTSSNKLITQSMTNKIIRKRRYSREERNWRRQEGLEKFVFSKLKKKFNFLLIFWLLCG